MDADEGGDEGGETGEEGPDGVIGEGGSGEVGDGVGEGHQGGDDSHVGLPTPRRLNPATPDRLPPEPAETPARPATGLPRRPGWLLDALPDIAPAIAADLGLILADPAFAPSLPTPPP